MRSLKVGHFTNQQDATGVSVFLFDQPSPAAYTLCGASPASHELHTIELEAQVPFIDGIFFTGGSAFGLNAVAGVMQWLQEQGRGYPTAYANVPIVPAAAIYDLGIKSANPPTATQAYEACVNAVENNPLQGRIGAGAGASVGKCISQAACMSGGMGFAELTLKNDVSVLAYAVVNSLGDVRDRLNNILAGARFPNGEFVDSEKYLLSGCQEIGSGFGNTTLIALFTNAKFSKIELKRISKAAMAGMARAISPTFTLYDGDIIICSSLSELIENELIVSAMSVEVVRQAIVNAVKNSIVL